MAPPSRISKTAKRLGEPRNGNLRQLLQRTVRTLNALIVDGLAKRGYEDIRLAHGSLLGNLDLGGNSITAIAERADITKQAMGTLADELELMGYLTRRVDEKDARVRILMCTDKGRRLMFDMLEIVDEIEGWYAATLGEQTMSGLRTALAAFVGIRYFS